MITAASGRPNFFCCETVKESPELFGYRKKAPGVPRPARQGDVNIPLRSKNRKVSGKREEAQSPKSKDQSNE
jgi:hypothetical protein